MTVPSDPEYLKKLLEVAEKNKQAGDWVEEVPLPGVVDEPHPVKDLLKRIGGDHLSSKH